MDEGDLVPVRVPGDDRRNRVGHVVALERAAAGEHLVKHAAERPDVAALVDRLAPAPAPGVMYAPCRESRLIVIAGEVIVGGPGAFTERSPPGRRLGQAEVEHLDRAVRRGL